MISQFAAAGRYHSAHDMQCEDVCGHFENDTLLCIALADGVSECKHGRTGALNSVNTALRLFEKQGDVLLRLASERLCRLIYDEVKYSLTQLARSENECICEYSSTLSVMVYNRKDGRLFVYSLGDSAAVTVGKDGHVRVLCAPCGNDSAVCQTITDDAHAAAYRCRIDGSDVSRIMLFSDGGWYAVHELIANGSSGDEILNSIRYSETDDDRAFISADTGVI